MGAWDSFTDHLHDFLFGLYPYLCAGVFLVGSLIRFDRDQYTWRSGSSRMLRARQLRWGSNLFQAGILVIFFRHFFGLLTLRSVYTLAMTVEPKQALAIVVGGVAGLVCFVGLTLLLHRRLYDPRIRRTSAGVDIAILVLLRVQPCLGLITLPLSLGHRDGAMMVQLSTWARHIVTFQSGAADHARGASLAFQLHMVMSMTLFLLTPFSRLVHIFSAPAWYPFRPWQIVRRRGGATRRPGPVTPPRPAAAE